MAEIYIVREHALGLAKAREIALLWTEQVSQKYGMECNYADDKLADEVDFVRSGIKGRLTVTNTRFKLRAQLGLLVGVFKGTIEAELMATLDALLVPLVSMVNAAPVLPPDEPEATQLLPVPTPLPRASEPPKLDKKDVNCADFDSLLALPGIGAADAKLLIQHRDSHGPLTSVDELATVLSLKPHIVERLRPLITFSMVMPKPPEPRIYPPPIAQAPEPTSTSPKPTGPVRAPIDF